MYCSTQLYNQASSSEVNRTADHMLLPSFLHQLLLQTLCSVETKGRFYRAFTAIVSALMAQRHWLPVLETDYSHVKSSFYDCVCLFLFAKKRW